METLFLKTKDKQILTADFFPASGQRCALLLHMMPATKESWRSLIAELVARGISCLAVDQRGHGSSQGGPKGYQAFSEAEQQAKKFDVEAGFEELASRGFVAEKMVMVGASIGANLSIRYLSEHAEVPLCVAMSPGLNYRGVATGGAIIKLQSPQKVLLMVSTEDDRESLASCQELNRLAPTQTELWTFSGLGHGTDMFTNDPALIGRTVDWIDKNL